MPGEYGNWWNYKKPTSRALFDDEKNVMADLRHDPCEAHCEICGGCILYGENVHYDGSCDDCVDWTRCGCGWCDDERAEARAESTRRNHE